MNINLHIEKLVLDGINLSPRDRVQLQAAVEAELTHLLTAKGLGQALEQGGSYPHVPARPVQVAPKTSPTQLGQQIARSVYGGIGK